MTLSYFPCRADYLCMYHLSVCAFLICLSVHVSHVISISTCQVDLVSAAMVDLQMCLGDGGGRGEEVRGGGGRVGG